MISCYVTRSFIRGIICEGSFATWNMRVRLHLDSPPISMMTDHVISTFFTVSCVFWAKHIFQSFIHRVIMEHILFTIQCIRIYRNLECQRWLWKIKNYCCLFSFAFPRLDSVKKNWRFCFCSTQKNGTSIAASFLDLQAGVNRMTCRMQICSLNMCPKYQTKLLQQNCSFSNQLYVAPLKRSHGFPGIAQLWGSHTDRADLTGTHTPEFRDLNLLTVTSSHAIFPPFSSPTVLRRRKPISSHSQTWSLLFVCEVFPYHLSKLVPIPQTCLDLVSRHICLLT